MNEKEAEMGIPVSNLSVYTFNSYLPFRLRRGNRGRAQIQRSDDVNFGEDASLCIVEDERLC